MADSCSTLCWITDCQKDNRLSKSQSCKSAFGSVLAGAAVACQCPVLFFMLVIK